MSPNQYGIDEKIFNFIKYLMSLVYTIGHFHMTSANPARGNNKPVAIVQPGK